jgi:signal peptidase II
VHFLSGKIGEDQPGVVIRKRILFGMAFGIALAADLLTKWAAFRFLRPGMRYTVIGGFFDLELAWNEGIVFGIPAPMVLTIIVSAIATAVVVWYLATPKGRPAVVQVYLGLILSGVIGNLYDRMAFARVRDFILFYIGGGQNAPRWPNFNLADAFILIGVGLAMLQFILMEDKKDKAAEHAPRPAAQDAAGKTD